MNTLHEKKAVPAFTAYDHEDYDNVIIKIIHPDSEYYGMEFYFKDLKMSDVTEENGDGYLSFDYEIINEPYKDFERTDALSTMIGDILYNILVFTMETKQDEILETPPPSS